MKKGILVSSGIVLVASFISFFILSIEPASAQGLVPSCPATGCGACQLVELAKNIINFMVLIAGMVGAGLFVYAGIMYVTSGPNPDQISQAHKIFWNVLIGLVLVLGAWLIVDTLLRIIPSGAERTGIEPWAQVICEKGASLSGGSSR